MKRSAPLKLVSKLPDADMQGAPAALLRAAQRAQEITRIAAMLAQNPMRMDYYKKYQIIIADYNREKARPYWFFRQYGAIAMPWS